MHVLVLGRLHGFRTRTWYISLFKSGRAEEATVSPPGGPAICPVLVVYHMNGTHGNLCMHALRSLTLASGMKGTAPCPPDLRETGRRKRRSCSRYGVKKQRAAKADLPVRPPLPNPLPNPLPLLFPHSRRLLSCAAAPEVGHILRPALGSDLTVIRQHWADPCAVAPSPPPPPHTPPQAKQESNFTCPVLSGLRCGKATKASFFFFL